MFSSKKNILKFLKLKDKSIFVKDFYISTKVKPKRIEHLQEKGIIWCFLLMLTKYVLNHSVIKVGCCNMSVRGLGAVGAMAGLQIS